jgi:hypothetical protein
MYNTSEFSEVNAATKEKMEILEILVLESIKAYYLGTQEKVKNTNVSISDSTEYWKASM